MGATPLARPDTSTGVKRPVVVLSPSWPSLFLPQHFTPPAVASARVWGWPAGRAGDPPAAPPRRCVGFPPSRPLLWPPQHFPPPAVVSAQVWELPAVMAATPLARPATSTGDKRPGGGW